MTSKSEKLHVGIVGAAGRASGFSTALQTNERVQVVSVCDVTEDKLKEAGQFFSANESYLHYEDMLEQSELDVVIIGTPMHYHAQQSIYALEHNINVISEVTAAISLEECKQLVAAAQSSKGQYLFAENCNYMKDLMIINEMVRRGVFGEVYFAEGEYLHELKQFNEVSKWRRLWQSGRNGITYGTHSLGPIMSWFSGDRISQVCCTGSGHHYVDGQNQRYEQEDTCLMLAKTEQNRLIKVRLDMLSERPYALNYALQGTKGCYESIRVSSGGKVSLKEQGEEYPKWVDVNCFADEYLPDMWRNIDPAITASGHGGSDYVMMSDFLTALIENRTSPIDIHKAMDMTLPGLISQESALNGGEWMEVPNSRAW